MFSFLAKILVPLIGTQAVTSPKAYPHVIVWKDAKPACRLVFPTTDQSSNRLARSTFEEFPHRFYNVELPVATGVDEPGTYMVFGTPANNPSLAKLVEAGANLTTQDIGDEGFSS